MMNRLLYFLLLSIFFGTEFFAQTQTVTLTTGSSSGTGNWTVPCGVTSITVQCWGGGGAGGESTSSTQAGGGGGAGGYSQLILGTSAGTVFNYTVGAGGSGAGGTSGGNTTFSTTVTNGGAFGTAGQSGGAGGAGGAGLSGNGGNGAAGGASTGGNGGAAVSGGAGGVGGAAGVAGGVGAVPGGGGGGAGKKSGASQNGGNGGNGRINILYTYPVIDAVASFTLGSCNTTTAALTATAITTPGWTGSWQCVGCTGISIASPTSATTTASGFAPGSTNYFQWVVTYTPTGCSVYDDLNVVVPSCPLTNGNCSNATSLTIDAGLMCSQVTTGQTAEVGECVFDLSPPNAGLSRQSLWYRFTATNDSLVLNVAGYGSFGPPSILVYGPFAPGAGCVPGCASATITGGAVQGLSQDPGVHTLLTGLVTTGNHDYLVQVMGFGNLNWDFCINVANPANNSTAPASALVISNCGTTYNGSTNGGYFASGSGTRHANLDNNLNTFVAPYTNATGNDVTFVVNNLSWFKFCTVNAGTYNVQFDVLSCVFSGANSGSQMAILKGTNGSMTNVWEATNPTTVSTPVQTSPNFALAAGECAYLVVDGFAGDACSYSYLLTNVTGGCILLPIELLSFNAKPNSAVVDISWATASEKNNDYFTVERSANGIDFETLTTVKGAGNSTDLKNYFVVDNNPLKGISYYRLKQMDFDGKFTHSEIVTVDLEKSEKFEATVFPNPVNEATDINISLSSRKSDLVNIVIMNSTGNVVTETNLELESANPTIQVKHKFEKGIYFLKITNKKGEMVTEKVIIR